MNDLHPPSGKARSNTWVWVFLAIAWICILLMGYRLGLHERFSGDSRASGRAPALVHSQATVHDSYSGKALPTQPVCDAHPPPSGSLLTQTLGRSSAAIQRAFMDIDNQHYFPVLLKFTNVSAGGAGKVVYVDKQMRDRLNMSAGNYRLLVQVGKSWCSIATGFNNGHTVRYQESVAITEGTVSVLRFVPMGVEPEDMLVSFTSGGMDKQAGGGAILELSRQMGGHSHIAAGVYKYPITFMADTRAP